MAVSKAQIKQDLLDQLERNGTTGAYYLDLVDDYMRLYEVKRLLMKDIKERGIKVEYTKTGGMPDIKTNDSVKDLISTNSQMIKILSELDIKAEGNGGDDWEM